MKTNRFIKMIAIIIMTIAIHGCFFFSNTNTNTNTNKNKEMNAQNNAIDVHETKIIPMDPFERVTSIMDTPCWMNTDPQNCPEYKNKKDKFLYIKSKIMTEKETENPSEKQNEALNNQISFKYFHILNKGIENELYIKYSQCREKKELCTKYYEEYKSLQEMIVHDFEIVDYYWNEVNAQWELNALATISYEEYFNDKKKIITDKILSKVSDDPIIPNNPGVIYID